MSKQPVNETTAHVLQILKELREVDKHNRKNKVPPTTIQERFNSLHGCLLAKQVTPNNSPEKIEEIDENNFSEVMKKAQQDFEIYIKPIQNKQVIEDYRKELDNCKTADEVKLFMTKAGIWERDKNI